MRETMNRPQRLRNPLTGLTRAWAGGTSLCAAIAAALLTYSGYPEFGEPALARTAATFVTGVALCGATLAGLIALPVLIGSKRRCDRELADIERGDHLLRWTYRSGEWQSFIQAERAEVRRIPWVMTVICAIIGLVAATGTADEDWAAGSRSTVFLCVFAGIAWCGPGFDWLIRRKALRACRPLQHGTPEAFFGRHGVYFNGVYLRYSQRGRQLVGVDLLTDRTPRTIVLTFRRTVSRRAEYEFLRLPVPAGQEQAAQQLARCLV
jgi:hypothetical protein